MKKILIISYMFPPIGGGGVVRVTKFSKYLPQFGWQPFILTVKKALYYVEDKSLLKELSSEVKIKRIGYFEPALWFKNRYWQAFFVDLLYPLIYIPDRQILWLWPAVIAGLKMIKRQRIKIIFTSSSSYTDHLVALILKKLTKVKWVADFRDEWSTNPGMRFPTKLHFRLAQYLEKKVVLGADQVISVSGPITTYLKSLSLDQDKFATLTNGFDPADFEHQSYQKGPVCHFLYAGALYGGASNHQLHDAISTLILKNTSFDFLGGNKRVSHLEAVRKMAQADVLLFILSADYRPGVYTGKLFEYLAARRPILALAPQATAAAKLIRRLGVGIVVDPQDREAIQKEILNFYKKWQKNQLYLKPVNIERYNRQKLTEKLAKIFIKQTEMKRKIKLCLIGDIKSIHNLRWVNYFRDKFEISYISQTNQKVKGARVYYLAPPRGLLQWKPLYFLSSIIRIRQIIKEVKPDLLHGQNLINGTWAYLSGFRPFLATAWGSDIFYLKNRIKIERWLVKKAIRQATAITFNSEALGQAIQKVSQRREDLYDIKFGVDTAKFKPKAPDLKYKIGLGLKDRDQVIFCSRGLTKLYNTDILIRAFARLAQTHPNLKLVLIKFHADPLFLDELIELTKELKMTQRVIFLESASQTEIVKLNQLAEVVVSIPSSDSGAISALEAMASGKKIVLTDLPFVKQWLSPQKDNFWQVKERDVESTVQAIRRALLKNNFQPMADFNRQMIVAKADFKQNMTLMEKLYRDIL